MIPLSEAGLNAQQIPSPETKQELATIPSANAVNSPGLSHNALATVLSEAMKMFPGAKVEK